MDVNKTRGGIQAPALVTSTPMPTPADIAHANEYFEYFLTATSLKNILGAYRSICDLLKLRPNQLPLFYPKLRQYLCSWKAKALWKRFDAKAQLKCYGKGKLCPGTRVLVVGGGPCGLRTAIEAQLLGAKVVVIEKRDRFSRNNVLHLWPFVIEDLRSLGAKKFFGKFCAGSIDHISIRQIQYILFKVCLLLGVELHTEVSFERLIEPDPDEKTGWRGEFVPSCHPVSQYQFDVVIGADGKRNTLQGFSRKEFRGKLAIAITANFINKKTEAEARVEEISGVAFIFNQKFFKDLYEQTGIDLENIVYYKDETHYFVMTAKKASLIEKGVIIQDLADTDRLLAPDNVNREALMSYAREAAEFSTKYQMHDLEFAVNHYGLADVAMFDFTSMYAAENASKVIERHGYRLLMMLVGDSLLEPFWPTGSGCARGFLSSMDAGWAIRSWASPNTTPLDVIAERESIYRLLAQTTPDNLNKDWKAYTIDPATRYPNLNKGLLVPQQVIAYYDTDDPRSIESMKRKDEEQVGEVPKKRRRANVDNEILLNWISDQIRGHENIQLSDIASVFRDGKVLCCIIHHYRPDLVDYNSVKDDSPIKNNQLALDVLEKEMGIPPIMTGEEITTTSDFLSMATYLTQIYDVFRGEIPHIKHPKLELPDNKAAKLNILTRPLKPSTFAPQAQPVSRHKRAAPEQVAVAKTGGRDGRPRKRRTVGLEKSGVSVDPEQKPPSMQHRGSVTDEDLAARIRSLEDKWRDPEPTERKPKDLMRAIGKIETSDWNIREIEKKIQENRSAKVGGKDREKVPKWSKEEFRARQNRMENKHLDRQDSREAKYADIDKNIKHLELKLKEGTSRDLGQNKVASITEKFVNKQPDEPKPIEKSNSKTVIMPQSTSDLCHFCDKRVYLMERLSAEGRFFHHSCFKCQYCHTQLKLGSYTFDREGLYGFKFYCVNHFGMQGEAPVTRVTHKPSGRGPRDIISPEKRQIQVTGVDLLDRVQTPERIEFANLSTGIPSSDQEESLSQMDEDEWTDKNFGASAAEFGSSDDESSSLSETESDDEDAYEEALDEPVTKEGTMKWAELLKKRYPKKRRNSNSDSSSTDHSSYYENSSDDDDSDTATEGEEEIRAREIRKQEVCVEPPVVQTDTGTDTEVVSEEETSSSSEIHNSATEISTDSEFAQDDPTPTREIPPILLNDFHVTKTRGSSSHQRERDPHVRKSRKSALQPKKIQVTSSFLQSPSSNGRTPKPDIELKLTPLVPSAPIIRKPALLPRTEGYALNRTQSTGGIAAKVSLELKKKYLLGETAVPGSIQKSGSSSVLDTKLKSFHSNISDCQKLLKPASEVSASMKTFCSKLDERVSPILSPQISSNTVLNKSDENIQPNRKPLPPPDIIKVETPVFENENHGRPRSPVHETSIIVPEIDWSKKKDQMSEDSLSESTSEMEDVKTPEFKYEPIPRVEIHPVEDLEENNDGEIKDDIPPDSLCFEAKTKPLQDDQHVSNNESPKSSINSDKKSLNQPKCLPAMQSESVFSEIHFSLHKKHKASNQNSEKQSLEDLMSVKNSSGRSTPSNADSCAEQMTAAFTETELSDWARDDDVSDDLECVEYELNEDKQKPSVNKKSKLPNVKSDVTLSDTGEHKDTKQVCDSKNGKDFKDLKNKTIITEAMNNLLSSNLDNIEFMDTGTETSSDDGIVDERNGYVLFNNEDDIMEDSLNPNINSIAETRNMRVYSKYDKPVNTGYCIFDIQDNFGSEVIELKPADLEKLRQKQNHLETEEDSLLIVEPGTTTEENTCSDSTVKILTNKRPTDANEEKLQPVNETVEHFKSTGLEEDNMGEKENVMKEEKTVEKEQVNQKRESNFQKQRFEEKLAKLKAEKATQKQNKELFSSSHKENLNETSNLEFQEHCQRLQSKIEFGNARDSIDIRKTRRKSKTEIQRPDLIQEEKEKSSPIHSSKDITLNLTPVIRPPNTFYKKECIEKERDVNQKLIQEMVMNKMRAENKSLERKKRNRSTPSPLKPFELTRSATADIVLQDSNTAGSINSASISAISSSLNKYATPDVLLSTNSVPLQKSQTSVSVSSFEKSASPIIKEQYTKPLSVYSSVSDRAYNDKSTELTHAKIHSNEYFTNAESFKTPSATSRQRIEGPKKTAEKLREDARARMRMLSNEELGLSPEDRLEKFREKMGIQKDKSNDQVFGLPENLEPLVIASEKRHSWLYSNDTLKKKKNNSFRRSKSGDDSDKKIFRQLSFLKSSDSLITEGKNQTPEKSEVRKMCKSDPNLLDTEEKKVKKKPKDRERKKSITTIISGLFTSKKSPSGSGSRRLFSRISPKSKDVSKEIVREEPVRRNSFSEVCSLKENKDIPPPIPPLPLNYVGYLLKDDGSDGEREWKYDRSSCDTLDQSAVLDCSSSSLNSRRTSKGARRARQAQLKRHRLAQEIQRKLEEAEVKTRALEERGVHVEKALRGEGGVKTSSIDETHLLQEWFDLMRDRTELRRYERELTVRAQELELEDRHARLQQELRERMENDAPKTSRDEETERHIINEMMDIVDKRDSLIAVLEEDRLRYSNEDRDFEEQMLAKGLRLTPIVKNP